MKNPKYINGIRIQVIDETYDLCGSFDPGIDGVYEADKVQLAYDVLSKQDNPLLIDIGACTGSYSLLATLIEKLTIHAYEPNFEAYRVLNHNLITNSVNARCVTQRVALSNYIGKGKFNAVYPPAVSALSMLGGKPNSWKSFNQVDVEVSTIDEEARLFCFIPTFIKIDTEGNELNVLKGGIETLKRYKPDLLVEYSAENTAQYGYDPREIIIFLKDLDYNIELLNNDIYAKP